QGPEPQEHSQHEDVTRHRGHHAGSELGRTTTHRSTRARRPVLVLPAGPIHAGSRWYYLVVPTPIAAPIGVNASAGKSGAEADAPTLACPGSGGEEADEGVGASGADTGVGTETGGAGPPTVGSAADIGIVTTAPASSRTDGVFSVAATGRSSD